MSTTPRTLEDLATTQRIQSSLPAGFDSAARPIIARHVFGVEPFPIGPIAAEVVADLRFRRQVQQLHRQGDRVLGEFLAEPRRHRDRDPASTIGIKVMNTHDNPKIQAKRTHARPTSPGKLARARELRKRGLHLRLIEAWRPYPTNPEPQGTRHMTEQELISLRAVINFFWRDEQRHYHDMKSAGDDPGDHIFRHLETLDHYLNREPADDVPSELTSEVSPFI